MAFAYFESPQGLCRSRSAGNLIFPLASRPEIPYTLIQRESCGPAAKASRRRKGRK